MAASPHRACNCFPDSDRDLEGRRREDLNPSKIAVMVNRAGGRVEANPWTVERES